MSQNGRLATCHGWLARPALAATEDTLVHGVDSRKCVAHAWDDSHETLKRMARHRIYTVSLASVYPHYVAKAERKGRTKSEVDEVIRWLTGYSQKQLDAELDRRTDLETFFANAPRPNPSRASIKGVVCGVRVEEIEEPIMKEIRYLDKLVDELARGKAMDKILRK
jgi:hypothetical protein